MLGLEIVIIQSFAFIDFLHDNILLSILKLSKGKLFDSKRPKNSKSSQNKNSNAPFNEKYKILFWGIERQSFPNGNKFRFSMSFLFPPYHSISNSQFKYFPWGDKSVNLSVWQYMRDIVQNIYVIIIFMININVWNQR